MLDELDLPEDLLEDLLAELLLLLPLLLFLSLLLPFLLSLAALRASSLVGILIFSPALILLPFSMPLARSRSLTETPVFSAILVSDSPFWTVTSLGCLGLECLLFLLLLELLELRSAVSLRLDLWLLSFSAYLALRERQLLELVFDA